MVYMILMELGKPEKTSAKLTKALKSMGKANQIVKNIYVLSSDKNASQIYFSLKDYIEESDNLLVIQTGKDWFGFLPVEKLNWLQEVME